MRWAAARHPHSRWLPTVPRRHLFVVGCPRSGTTALVRLLHAAPEIVMGMERYRQLLHHLDARDALFRFGPKMYKPTRFFDFREGDTTIRLDDERFREHYLVAAARLADGRVSYVGDKVPAKETIVLALAGRFMEARFVFIYRDLLGVVNSYCRRARDPHDHWPATSQCDVATRDWLAAFSCRDALTSAVGKTGVFMVKYETLFSGDRTTVEMLWRWLGIRLHLSVLDRFERMTADWNVRSNRPLVLTDDERMFVRQHSAPDFDCP